MLTLATRLATKLQTLIGLTKDYQTMNTSLYSYRRQLEVSVGNHVYPLLDLE